MKNLILFLSLLSLSNANAQTGWFLLPNPSTNFGSRTIHFWNESTGIVAGYKTFNGGYNWTSMQTGSGQAIHFPSSQTGYMVGSAIIKTTNAGANWVLKSNPPYFDILYGVYFINDNTGFCVGNGGGKVVKTYNGGNNWIVQQAISSTYYLRDVYFTSNNTGYVVGADIPNTYVTVILKTINQGVDWDSTFLPSNCEDGETIRFINDNTGFVGGISFVAKTVDAGSSWQVMNVPGFIQHFSFPSSTVGYAACWSGIILKTTDGGNSWFRQTSPTNNDLFGIFFTNENTGYIGGLNKVLKTTDGGGPPFGITPISNEVPSGYELKQNYPNPFNPSTKINFSLPKKSFVKIIIYDAPGGTIAELVNQDLNPGTYSVDWNASNFPSGIYFYTISTGEFSETRKAVLIK